MRTLYTTLNKSVAKFEYCMVILSVPPSVDAFVLPMGCAQAREPENPIAAPLHRRSEPVVLYGAIWHALHSRTGEIVCAAKSPYASAGSEGDGVMRTELGASKSTSKTFFASNKSKASWTLSTSGKSISTTKAGVTT
jgi:hypothetical protein